MPAHIKAALTQTQLSIPVAQGRLVLGTWQGIYCSNTAPRRTGGSWCCICWGREPRAYGCGALLLRTGSLPATTSCAVKPAI